MIQKGNFLQQFDKNKKRLPGVIQASFNKIKAPTLAGNTIRAPPLSR